jgi:cyclopropane-fatty-acyl-phospholipid synthase
MQSITIAEELFDSLLRRDDFISKHIFPGGALPSLTTLRKLGADRGLTPINPVGYAGSYARTLRRWRQTFDAVWPEIARPPFDERFRRTWDYYLAYCEAGFRIGRIDVFQIGFRRTGS